MPTRMMQRNNIVNGFVLVNDEATNKALAEANSAPTCFCGDGDDLLGSSTFPRSAAARCKACS